MDLTAMYFKPDNKAFDLENIDDDKTILDVNSTDNTTDKDDDLSVKSLSLHPSSTVSTSSKFTTSSDS